MSIVKIILALIITTTGYVPPALWDIVPAAFEQCATEDSDWCYWDADRRGNGVGESFVTINDRTYLFDRG